MQPGSVLSIIPASVGPPSHRLEVRTTGCFVEVARFKIDFLTVIANVLLNRQTFCFDHIQYAPSASVPLNQQSV